LTNLSRFTFEFWWYFRLFLNSSFNFYYANKVVNYTVYYHYSSVYIAQQRL